ncbi:aminotransferase class I/II-fold pyridoxal phosphate-dependent enzyme [Streptomyces uncialis]|uniref:aminotransferase class I/II-fold pyridoxal phosphate-dependent enzyme n=1 Tax=Streptomyces uncialis TaxID=1048205 RepID=UPI00378BFE1A
MRRTHEEDGDPARAPSGTPAPDPGHAASGSPAADPARAPASGTPAGDPVRAPSGTPTGAPSGTPVSGTPAVGPARAASGTPAAAPAPGTSAPVPGTPAADPGTQRLGHGPLRYGPALPGSGLSVPPGIVRAALAAAGTEEAAPVGGGPDLLRAAAGYWERRGARARPDRIAAAPGGAPLLLAVAAALGGDVLTPRPCPAWWLPQARLLGRTTYTVPTPAECGGVPDPYALLETVRRVRAEGGDPRLLVIAVADDPTGTVAPPELVHEAVEAAAGAGLHIVSDETWRDTTHPASHGREPEPARPAGMAPDRVTVLVDLAGALLPGDWPAAVARFPATAGGGALHDAVLDVLAGTGARIAAPVAAAARHVLTEPAEVTARTTASARVHGRIAAAVHDTLRRAGVLALPPTAGRHLYADLGPLRAALAARGVTDAQELEDHLGTLLGMPAPGGHRFGDALTSLRVRLDTAAFLGTDPRLRAQALTVPDPLEMPQVKRALTRCATALDGLRADARRREPTS